MGPAAIALCDENERTENLVTHSPDHRPERVSLHGQLGLEVAAVTYQGMG